MRFIGFFSGIGGFTRGLELAGHECVGHCEFDKYAEASYRSMHCISDNQRDKLMSLSRKERQEEILKPEYLNGEWYAQDIVKVRGNDLPIADVWCFGAPCQDFSISNGNRSGLSGERSSLVREIFRLLEEVENKPEWIIYENVKGMLSSNKGWDFLAILSEMDRGGYDIEWQNINSKWFVPQNRERIYTVGHLRDRGRKQVLPIAGATGQNSVLQVGMINSKRNNPNQYRVYDKDGISSALNCTGGGGREPHIIGRYHMASGKTNQQSGVFAIDGYMQTLAATDYKEPPRLAIPYKTKDTSCNIGVVELNSETMCVRKLTPKECFRLQGWCPDDYFEKAQQFNSNTQLYKQAGNGVTVDVVKAIGERLR